jgi:sigma-B regulation protein RsbU (phosphoserine phosphatase)
VIALGTDGIWETLDPAGNEFGRARFEALLKQHAALPAAEICGRIIAALAAFRGSTRVHDDVTLVIIKRDGGPPARAAVPGPAGSEG